MHKSHFHLLLVMIATVFISACNPYLYFWKEALDDKDKDKKGSLSIFVSEHKLPVGAVSPMHALFTSPGGVSTDVIDQVTWQSSDNDVAVVIDNQLVAKSIDTGTITANYKGYNDALNITVTNNNLTQLYVYPRTSQVVSGLTLQYEATGFFDDGHSYSMFSNDLNWSSSILSTASINSRGLATGLTAGSTLISAASQGVDSDSYSAHLEVISGDLVSIEINPTQTSMPAGRTVQLQVKAHFSEGDIIEDATAFDWHTALGNVSIDSSGLALGEKVGPDTVYATLKNDTSDIKSNDSNIEVNAALVTSLDITSSLDSLAKGTSIDIVATATFSDGSSHSVANSPDLQWSSSQTKYVTITVINYESGPVGSAYGAGEGESTITASMQGFTDSIDLTVTGAEMTELRIAPNTHKMLVAKGITVDFSATAIFSDNSSQLIRRPSEISWSLGTSPAARIDRLGRVTAQVLGLTHVYAKAKSTDIDANSAPFITDGCFMLPVDGLQFSCPTDLAVMKLINPLYADLPSHPENAKNYVNFPWETANEYCDGLLYNGYSDWRLPSIAELELLYTAYNINGEDIDTHWRWATDLHSWSSEQHSDGVYKAYWLQSGNDGQSAVSTNATDNLYTTCVRGE